MRSLRLLPRHPSALLPRLAAAAAAGLLLAAVGIARASDPPRYTAVDLGALSDADPARRGHAWGYGINNAGDIAARGYPLGEGDFPKEAPLLYAGGRWTDLSAGGGRPGFAGDVNNSGVVVGTTYDPAIPNGDHSSRYRATLWTASGAAVDLGTLGDPLTQRGLTSQALAVNDAGLIVGTSFLGSGSGPGPGPGTRAVFWQDGLINELPGLGGRFSTARDVNTSGLIAGISTVAGDREHAVVWRSGVPVDLGTLGGDQSGATAVNDAGWVVGHSTVTPGAFGSGANRAALWRDGAVTEIPAPAGSGGVTRGATGINSAGDILGYWGTETEPSLGFLHTGGVTYDIRSLMEPGISLTGFSFGAGINDAGWFTGSALVDGEEHLFLFKPVPEPSAAVLAACAGAGALLVRRRSGRGKGALPA